MDGNIIAFISSVIVSIIGAVSAIAVAKIKAKDSAKTVMNTQSRDILADTKKAFDKIEGIDKKIENGIAKSDKVSVSDRTEDFDRAQIEALTQFVEKYRIKVDILELFSVDIPAGFFYNFAIYYSFVKKDFITGSYFIDKTLEISQKQKSENQIDYLRWAARIQRLKRNEGEAARILTKILGMVKEPDFQRAGAYDDFYNARLYRSRWFCYFNQNDYHAAIHDFNRAISLIGEHSDTKIPYCYCGLAMAIYRECKKDLNKKVVDKILEAYGEAIRREPYLYGKDAKELLHNLNRLESENKYFFTELEKETLEGVYELYRSKKHN
jgi:tetratricopeptide (TPR) repeat protein